MFLNTLFKDVEIGYVGSVLSYDLVFSEIHIHNYMLGDLHRMFMYRMLCQGACVLWHTCVGEMITLWSQFSSSIFI